MRRHSDTDNDNSKSIEVNVGEELYCVKRKRKDKEEEEECSGNVKKKFEWRRCELCGGGSDGKPPLISIKDMPLNELDAGFGHEDGWLGELLGPIAYPRNGIPRIWVHYQCLLWSPEVHLTGTGSWKNVEAALTRGKSLKCSHCRRRGATLGCRIEQCPRTYHLACARFKGCKFEHKEFVMACTNHRDDHIIFQQPPDHDHDHHSQYDNNVNNSDDDDGKFGNIVPTFVGGRDHDSEKEKEKEKLHFGMGGWESVGGLKQVIDCMKEVVVLPLLYPEFFDRYAITPPRGVLLHGYPGTGKTHVVRALVASCARGHKRIAYFSCKGADCLGKYVGDSEKHLKKLFQAAQECQPSIIFFDEIDGLAPSRTNTQQDQTHTTCVVSTLLALLDGINSRGSVVVIGATNRPNAIDPALRRPGRFDREIYFPLPSLEDRISILSLYTQNWPPKPPPLISKPNYYLLQWIATKTPGFAGADLQALCTQTAITALKRNLRPLLKLEDQVAALSNRPPPPPPAPLSSVVVVVQERDWLEALSTCPPPCSRRESSSVAASYDVASSPIPSHLIPCLIRPLSTLLVSLYMEETICLPNALCKAATTIQSVMVSALKLRKKIMESTNKWWFHVDDLIEDNEIANEIINEIGRKWQLEAAAGPTACSRVNIIDDVDQDSSSFANELNAKKRLLFILEKSPGFRIMIAGNPRCGQRHLATFILNSYSEHVEIRKLDLTTLICQGYTNNLGQGIAITLADFVSRGSCLIFMPRVDLWAIETSQYPSEEELRQCSSSIQRPSFAWNIFTQQLELLSLSTPFIFLATSDVPFLLLPQDIRDFFGNDLSNCKLAEQKKHRIPRFSIQVDDSFKHEVVMDQSAGRVSKDLAKLLVVLIHQKYHDHDKDDGELEQMMKHKEDRNNLLVSEAISMFGYQILQNPQFSPLCVVTSKFKLEELGPCASVSKSEWKDLNKLNDSCVVHDHDPTISDENHGGRVKGLVAVGLLASRGVYTTLQQVCSDVGAVLSVLVEKVNAKVDAGKDRLQYLGVLSQAAWLQDIVDTWAYYYTQKSLKVQADDCVRARDGRSIICSIHCCSGCVNILHVLTKKILRREFRSSKRFDGSTESIHEIVMWTWVKLARKVTKSFVEGKGCRKDHDEEEYYKKLVESYGFESCGCKISRNNNNMIGNNGRMAISECRLCHSTPSSSTTISDDRNYKFVFRNNILVEDHHQQYPTQHEHHQLSFHCNYHTLCLASIIQLIIAKKKNKNKNKKKPV